MGEMGWEIGVASLVILFVVFAGLAYLVVKLDQERDGDKDKARRRDRAAVEEEEDEEGEERDDGRGVVRRANARKEAKRKEKQDAQQQDREFQQQRDKTKNERAALYEQKHREKAAAREKEAQDRADAEAAKKRREEEEFAKWTAKFAVEKEGEDAADDLDLSVENFVKYVQMRKVVRLEDLSADFRMKTSAAIDRLKDLEKGGRLNGIFDDRGKYLYITQQEMSDVAAWLTDKGRLNRKELLAACNRLIRMDPTADDLDTLRREARSTMESIDEALGKATQA